MENKKQKVSVNKVKPRKVKGGAHSDETIARVLMETKGLQYLAAEKLGVEPATISARISESPYLQQARDKAIERRLDVAELNLAELTEEKNLGAICFLLKTKGKHRGYDESNQPTVSVETLEKYMGLMNKLKELQSLSKEYTKDKDE